MTKITENEIELFAIELLEQQGFEYRYTLSVKYITSTSTRSLSHGHR